MANLNPNTKALIQEAKERSKELQKRQAELRDKQQQSADLTGKIVRAKEQVRIKNRAMLKDHEKQELKAARDHVAELERQKAKLENTIVKLHQAIIELDDSNLKRDLNNQLKVFAYVESVDTVHAALKRSGLLKALKETLVLIRLIRPEISDKELKDHLLKVLFDAVFLEKPSFDDALESFNQKYLETPTQP